MNARRAVATALLLTFPASTFAQTSSAPRSEKTEATDSANRLDLSSLKHITTEPERKPFTLSFSGARPDFQQAQATQPCVESEARGRTDADRKGINQGWFWGGVGFGALLGFFGMGAAPLTASLVKPKPKSVPAGLDNDCYASGFGSKRRHENALAAFWGSGLGTALWFVFYAVAVSVND